MAIHTIPEWHRNYIVGFEIDLLNNVIENRSKLNMAVKTREFPGDSWMIGIEYRGMPLTEFWAVRAFWLGVRGKANHVRTYVLDHGIPAGAMRGSPTADAAGEGWVNMVIRNSTGGLLQGDFIGVQLITGVKQLLMVRNSQGVTVLAVDTAPPLRRGVAAGSPVTWDRPYVDCLIVEPPKFATRGNMSEGFSVQLLEVPT